MASDELVGQIRGRVDDHGGVRSGAPCVASITSPRVYDLARWGRPWSQGPPGSSARTSRARSPSGATTSACSPGAARTSPRSGPRVRAGDRRRHRPARGPPRDGRSRAGLPRRRADLAAERDREAVWDTNVRGTRIVLRRRSRPGSSASSSPRRSAAIGVGEAEGAVDETATFDIGHLGITYVNSKHEAEVEALRARRPRAARDDRQPVVRPRSGRDRAAARWTWSGGSSWKQIPAYVDGGAQHRRRARRRRRAPPGRQEGRDRRALHPLRPQLHARPPVRRPRPDLGRRSAAAEAAGAGAAWRLLEAGDRLPLLPVPGLARRDPLGHAVVDATATPAPSRSWASSRARTRRRSRRPCAGRPPRSATGRRGRRRGAGVMASRAGRAGASGRVVGR